MRVQDSVSDLGFGIWVFKGEVKLFASFLFWRGGGLGFKGLGFLLGQGLGGHLWPLVHSFGFASGFRVHLRGT